MSAAGCLPDTLVLCCAHNNMPEHTTKTGFAPVHVTSAGRQQTCKDQVALVQFGDQCVDHGDIWYKISLQAITLSVAQPTSEGALKACSTRKKLCPLHQQSYLTMYLMSSFFAFVACV